MEHLELTWSLQDLLLALSAAGFLYGVWQLLPHALPAAQAAYVDGGPATAVRLPGKRTPRPAIRRIRRVQAPAQESGGTGDEPSLPNE
ncbi:hypothetical protein ACFFK0_11570 [Paenibacillus chartarius]|uniref:Uncharacterized protein n=1 Tax=Paenibacillus chartarius TaxID=747481 RepID=A0ABV6DKG7_9BACL